jgi:hypothetical protein
METVRERLGDGCERPDVGGRMWEVKFIESGGVMEKKTAAWCKCGRAIRDGERC